MTHRELFNWLSEFVDRCPRGPILFSALAAATCVHSRMSGGPDWLTDATVYHLHNAITAAQCDPLHAELLELLTRLDLPK